MDSYCTLVTALFQKMDGWMDGWSIYRVHSIPWCFLAVLNAKTSPSRVAVYVDSLSGSSLGF